MDDRICPICEELAPNGHLKNYGVFACFSCRAFFRRTVQKDLDKRKSCKGGHGKCKITVATRKSCKKCRYEKCLAVGMNANSVMTLEQKVARFRKGTVVTDKFHAAVFSWSKAWFRGRKRKLLENEFYKMKLYRYAKNFWVTKHFDFFRIVTGSTTFRTGFVIFTSWVVLW